MITCLIFLYYACLVFMIRNHILQFDLINPLQEYNNKVDNMNNLEENDENLGNYETNTTIKEQSTTSIKASIDRMHV